MNDSRTICVLKHDRVFVPSQSHYNLRLKKRAKMTLSREQNIVMPKNINFVLFHCKGKFGPERYLRRRLEIRRTPNFRMCPQFHQRMNVDI